MTKEKETGIISKVANGVYRIQVSWASSGHRRIITHHTKIRISRATP